MDKRDLQPGIFWTKGRYLVEFDEFNGYEERTKKFKETLCTFEENSKDSFYNAILHALNFKNTNKPERFYDEKKKIEQIFGKEFLINRKIKKKCYALTCPFLILRENVT